MHPSPCLRINAKLLADQCGVLSDGWSKYLPRVFHTSTLHGMLQSSPGSIKFGRRELSPSPPPRRIAQVHIASPDAQCRTGIGRPGVMSFSFPFSTIRSLLFVSWFYLDRSQPCSSVPSTPSSQEAAMQWCACVRVLGMYDASTQGAVEALDTCLSCDARCRHHRLAPRGSSCSMLPFASTPRPEALLVCHAIQSALCVKLSSYQVNNKMRAGLLA